MRIAKLLSSFTLGLLGLLMMSCGGSGASGTSSGGSPVRFTIHWGARSMAISAPSSALSAVLTLTGAGIAAGDLTMEVDRRANTASYSQTYTSSAPAKPGTYPLSIKFFDKAAGAGDVVATANATVTIQGNGSGIGTVSVTNTIASVAVDAGQVVFTPNSAVLTFTAKDAQGGIVAVTPGSGVWSQVDGVSNMTLAANGTSTGLRRGFSNVKVTVDGVSSLPVAVEATADPSAAPTVLNFDNLPAMPTQVSGNAIPPANQLSDFYLSSDGISFASLAPYVAVVTMPTGTAPSPPNSIAGASASGVIQYGQATPVTFTFFDPLTTTAPGVTKSFSLIGDLDGNAGNTVELDAYGVNGNLIGKVTTADVGGEVMRITMPTATIHKVVFLGAPGFNDGVALDNITFGPVVPVSH